MTYDANAHSAAKTKETHRGSIPFVGIRSAADALKIEVSLVMVPPSGAGVAYGHDSEGRCVSVRGARHEMLKLYQDLREQGRASKPHKVYVTESMSPEVTPLERNECPTHMLPDAPEGSIVAWAPY